MSPLREHLECLLERRDLAESQAEHLLTLLASSEDSPALSGAIIATLRCKGVVAVTTSVSGRHSGTAISEW